MRPMEEITIRLTNASRMSQKCERALCGRDRDRVRGRTRDLRAAGALLRERKVVADLQDVYYDAYSDREAEFSCSFTSPPCGAAGAERPAGRNPTSARQ